MSETSEYRQSRFRRPPGACEILLVRHGESAPARPGAPFPLVDGHGDPPLDPAGEAQAERVAERLVASGEPIAAIYVTTLRRTAQTAAPLAARLGLEPVVEADLREVHLGAWEGGEFRRRVAEGDPIAQRMFAEQRWDVIPGAEPGDAFAARVAAGVGRVADAHPDQTVVAVVHGGVIGQVLATASGAARGFTFVGADNASISHVVVTDDRWAVRCFNDTSHLSPTFAAEPEPLT
jgi:2,3-bisphosphoglycerate-dependent phosphoglycerate mutase